MIRFQFYPRSQGLTKELQLVIDCFKKNERTLEDGKQRDSNDVLALLKDDLEACGYKVESGKKKKQIIEVPVFYGENNEVDKAFHADALNEENKIVIEVEAGRAYVNNQFLKDIFEACVMIDIDYLVIAVLKEYKINKGSTVSRDYQKIKAFIDSLYASNRLKLPLKGILLIGY